MTEILQYGALGILGVLVLFVVPFLIKFLVDFIKELKEDIKTLSNEYKGTIDNHLDTQAHCMKDLADAINRLADLWGNGK